MVLCTTLLYAKSSTFVYDTFESATKKVFPGATYVTKNIQLSDTQVSSIESRLMMQMSTSNITMFEFKKNNALHGWGMVTNYIGKHEPITFFVGVSPDFKIQGIVVMVYREDYGNAVKKRRFLRQFNKKSLDDPMAVHQDITSITGATLSSYAIANGARDVLLTVSEAVSPIKTTEGD